MHIKEIDVCEFRIGNLFLYEKTVHIITNLRVSGKAGYFKSKWLKTKDEKGEYSHINTNSCEYISLTEKELLRLGLSKIDDTNNFQYGNNWLLLKLEDNDWNNISFDVFLNGTYITCISYVHDLQNLYYSLTKQELDYETKN